MIYGAYKYQPRRTALDKVLHDKTFVIGSNPQYDGYQCGFVSIVYNFFVKKSRDTTAHTGTNELHRLITGKFKECKRYLSFKDNYWGAELTYMQLISKYNKRSRFLQCVIDIHNKYAWIVLLEDKK